MHKEEIIGIILTGASYLLAYYVYQQGVEFLQVISTFLAGAFTTYVVQHRLQVESEKRKIERQNAITMRDQIYGPIFGELSKILESVKLVQGAGFNKKEIMAHHLFQGMEPDLKGKLSELIDRVEKYEGIHHASDRKVQGVIRKAVEKVHRVDIGSNGASPVLRLLIHDVSVSAINLKQCLFRRLDPRDFVSKETKKWGKSISTNLAFGAKIGNLNDFESLYKLVLQEIEKDPLYIEERKQRRFLIDELVAFLEQIKVFVDID